MNVDRILQALNDQEVDFILIGGMNFLLQQIFRWNAGEAGLERAASGSGVVKNAGVKP